ncbi:MAG: family transporter [Microbacteriaceae bacterium]|nr:family transporter [Microbacteriaceae bacterium]
MTFARRKAPTPTASVEAETTKYQAEATLPVGVRIAGAWSWRILAIAGVIGLFIFLISTLREIVVPFMVAILLAALLVPFVQFLQRHGWPKGLAVALAEVGLVIVVAGLVVLVVFQVRGGFPELRDQSMQAYQNFKDFLLQSPLHLTEKDINGYLSGFWTSLQKDSQGLVNGALSVGSSAGHILAGLLLTLFGTLFMLIDGKRIFAWITRLFPRKARPAVDGAGHAGWVTLTNFVRVQIFVAFVDAVGIGLGAWIVGLAFGTGFPLVIPIAIAVFLGSFIPVIGAVFTGVLSVFVALVYINPIAALVMLGVVILVQQVEGHVLQPFVMGTAVKVHPLAVVFAVAAGGFLAGIPGALFAVPVIATLNVIVNYIASGRWRTTPPETPTIDPGAEKHA